MISETDLIVDGIKKELLHSELLVRTPSPNIELQDQSGGLWLLPELSTHSVSMISL